MAEDIEGLSDRGISTEILDLAVKKLLNTSNLKTNEYLGVFAVDYVDDLISSCKTCIDKKIKFFWLIYNNQPSSEGGEHWRLLLFYRNSNKWRIYIYDSLGGESLLRSYPELFGGIKIFKNVRSLTSDYNNRNNDDIIKYTINVDKTLSNTINNKGGDTEEKYFNDILQLIIQKNRKYKIKISTVLNRIQNNNTPTCGLYCLFFIDLTIIPLYDKRATIITKNIIPILKNHTNFFGNVFAQQSLITILKGDNNKKRARISNKNERGIKNIYIRYISQ